MSVCSEMPRPAPAAPARAVSSLMTRLNRKSGTPPPPYSSGMAVDSSPADPAVVNSSRGTMPSRAHCAVWGTISLSTNCRTAARKSSCSVWNSVRRMMPFPWSVSRGGEAGRALLAQRGDALGDVGAHEGQHLVGGGGVEGGPGGAQPVVHHLLSQPDGRLGAGSQLVGHPQRLVQDLVLWQGLGHHADALGLGTGDHLAGQQVVAGLGHA